MKAFDTAAAADWKKRILGSQGSQAVCVTDRRDGHLKYQPGHSAGGDTCRNELEVVRPAGETPLFRKPMMAAIPHIEMNLTLKSTELADAEKACADAAVHLLMNSWNEITPDCFGEEAFDALQVAVDVLTNIRR